VHTESRVARHFEIKVSRVRVSKKSVCSFLGFKVTLMFTY